MDDFEIDDMKEDTPHFEGEHDGDGFYLEECLEEQMDSMGKQPRHQRLDEIDDTVQKELDKNFNEYKLTH